jgi:hypothetical protein
MGIKIKKADPVLPYNGNSGWSGSDTSHQRAKKQDKEGETQARQRAILLALLDAESDGLTWKEVDSLLEINHHGSTTGSLSNLHKANKIARLAEKRGRCKIYVHPDYINGRETERQGR